MYPWPRKAGACWRNWPSTPAIRPCAREAGERAVEADPESIAAWTALISIDTGAEDWAGALAVVRRAQALNPDDLSLALSAASIRAEQNDLEGALEEWDRLLTISPENATAYAMRGALNLRLERPRAASSTSIAR